MTNSKECKNCGMIHTPPEIDEAIYKHFWDMDSKDISLCSVCMCMTHTVAGNCGKCGCLKPDSKKDSELDSLAVQLQLNELQTRWLKDAIKAHYISRKEALEMIGEDEPQLLPHPKVDNYKAVERCVGRNQLRAELRELLNGDKDG